MLSVGEGARNILGETMFRRWSYLASLYIANVNFPYMSLGHKKCDMPVELLTRDEHVLA
jgi:hypothetical protein